MKFTIAHARDGVGFQIDVQVNAEGDERLASVKTEMDNFPLATDTLPATEVQYQRRFSQVSGSGINHLVRVTATNTKGTVQSASQQWT